MHVPLWLPLCRPQYVDTCCIQNGRGKHKKSFLIFSHFFTQQPELRMQDIGECEGADKTTFYILHTLYKTKKPYQFSMPDA